MSNPEPYAPGAAFGAEVRKDGEKWTLVLVRELRHPPAKVWKALTVSFSKAPLDSQISPLRITKLSHAMQKWAHKKMGVEVCRSTTGYEKTNAPDLALLLGKRTERCSDHTCANGENQFTALVHSITLVACTKNELGIFIPSVLAVFILTINSNIVACSTGISPGLVPLNILSMK